MPRWSYQLDAIDVKLVSVSVVRFTRNHLTLTLNPHKTAKPLSSPSQGRDPDVSGVHEITTKWLGTRVSTRALITLTHTCTRIYAGEHGDNQCNTLARAGSFAFASFGPCLSCRILAAVRAKMHIPNNPDLKSLSSDI